MMMWWVIRLPASICAMFFCIAQSTTNLEIKGTQVSGESFHLDCSASSKTPLIYAAFYRSTISGQSGTLVGYKEFYQALSPSCKEGTDITTNYTVSCNSEGSMFTLAIPNNTIEHKTYWRCQTYDDNSALDNNVINISIIVKITGISWISPVVGPGNTVDITSDVPTTLQCQTTQGRPAANITWYIDNAPLYGGTTTTTPVSGDIVITTGSLILTVNRTADDNVLSCRAKNYVNMEPLESTVKPIIRVKYAPSGPPVMNGYDNGTVYTTRVGRSQSVTCQVPTAHPVPTLSLSCPSYTVTGTTPLPEPTDVVSSSITWTATSTEPRQTCQCTSYQEVSGTVTTYINIDVLYPPSSPTYQLDVTGVSTNVSVSIVVIQGDTVHLTCNTVSNPSPTTDQYNWTRSTGGAWPHGQHELTLTNIDRSSDDTYTCEVTNTMTTTDGTSDTGTNTSQISVHVLFPPSSPTYQLDVSGSSIDVSGSIDVIQGDTVYLICNTVSNPPPTTNQYKWTRSTGGSWVHGEQELIITDINLSDDAEYACKVTNTMTPTVGGTRTGTYQSVIAVNVLYPPAAPNITYRCITNPVSISITHNTSYPVTCQSDGNPVPSVQWTWRGHTTFSGTLSVYNIQNSGNYTCTVKNTMRRRPGDPSKVSKSGTIEIQLLHGPEIDPIPNQTIVEGSRLNVTCTAHSNPPITSYYWSRPGSTERYIEGSVLHIPSVLRANSGVYTCHVGNAMLPTCAKHSIIGTGSRGTMVEVHYPATLEGHTANVEEHLNASLSCTAAGGIPATYTFYNWSHLALDTVTILRSLPGTYNGTTTTLTLSDVNYEDTGYYRCNVSNGVPNYITGEPTTTTDVMFTVNSSPVVISETSDVTASMGGNASLMVTFYSYKGSHQPNVTWFKNINGSFENITEMRYDKNLTRSNVTLTVYGHNLNKSGFVTKLSVHNITEEDFTNYSCVLRNNIGITNSTVITLRPKGPPEVPKIVDTTATEGSITIYFVPGFHGGSDQHFIVQLYKSDDEPFAIMANETVGRKSEELNTTIEPLASDTEYTFMYFSENSDGQSDKRTLTLTTKMKASGGPTDSTLVTGVAIGAAAALTFIAVIVAIVVILRRRTQGKSCPRVAELLNTRKTNRDEKQKGKSRPPETELSNTRTNNRVKEQTNSRKRVQETTIYTNHTLVKANGVEIYKLYDYIMEKLDDDAEYLKTQFYKLQSGLCADHDVGMMKQNKNKNRYKNMIAYDHSRVHLEDRTEQQTDYVNACYILGYEKVEKFIACQGPTKTMVQDFWQMVWQEETSKIVMLTNLVELGMIKCLQYWPEAGTVVYGDVTVSLMRVRKLPDYTIRSLDIRKGDEPPHRVDQFHFQSWPDKNVPESAWTLVNFWKTVDAHSSPLKGPTVVHCSAGVGRTGTYIALDWLYNQARVEGVVNFFDCVETLRRQRVNMVQTPTQYAFLHETVAEALSVGTLPMLSIQYRQWYTHMLEIDEHGDKDQDRSTRLEVQHKLFMQSLGDSGTNASANGLDNGSYDDCYNLKNFLDQTAFIVSRSPTKTEEPALLQLIADRKVEIIINLSNTDCIHWQNQVSCLQLDMTDWDHDGVPCSMTTCVGLIEDVLKVQPLPTETRPILLHSDFPIERCGLLCILLNEVYRIKLNKQISILQSAKSMQTADGRFVAEPNLAQYKFCHNVILEYLNQAEIYQNLVA